MEDEKEPYRVWKIPKKKGGFRTIESPCDELKAMQRVILRELTREHKVSPFCHGFCNYRNITTNALTHVGKQWVASFDVADFFPSITLDLFKSRIQTLSDTVLNYCFHDFNDGKGKRLPQGAPTSPFLSNLYLKRFDWFMAWMAHPLKCDYSRYADDIVISGSDKKAILQLIAIGGKTLKDRYSLEVHPAKTKIVPRSRRQLVCGVVVNEKCNTQRKLRKNLRAELHQLKLKGGELPNDTKGRIAFHKMVRETKKTTLSSTDIIDQILVVKALMQGGEKK